MLEIKMGLFKDSSRSPPSASCLPSSPLEGRRGENNDCFCDAGKDSRPTAGAIRLARFCPARFPERRHRATRATPPRRHFGQSPPSIRGGCHARAARRKRITLPQHISRVGSKRYDLNSGSKLAVLRKMNGKFFIIGGPNFQETVKSI